MTTGPTILEELGSETRRSERDFSGGLMSGMNSSCPRKYLYNEIVDQIQHMIAKGEVKVGDRLPPERALAQAFRVSRNCIRQAIQALAEKHILESRQGDGTYVCAPDQTALISSFALAIQAQKELLHEIMEFRLLMEPQIAFLAAKHITKGELDRLKIIVCDQQRKILANEQDMELDAAFHLQLAESSRNRVILEVIKTMEGILNESRSEFLQSDIRRQSSILAHLKIIDALEKGDPEMARQAMREHLMTVGRVIFGEHEDEGGESSTEF
jgi:GntR family transcriptional regulator, transcriptional repressor for pyruvate dehydrogenase complex